MHPLWIVLIGVVIVVGGVLVLRLHAFLALVLAAIVVGALTPPSAIERHAIEKEAISWKHDDATSMVVLRDSDAGEGMQYLVLRIDPAGKILEPVGELTVVRVESGVDDETKVYARFGRRGQFQSLVAGDLVVHPPAWRAAKEAAGKTVGERVAMLVWQRRSDLKELSGAVQAALASGGVIILITAAGGAFGGMMQQTGIAGLMKHLPSGSPLVVIVLAFLITMAVRTAQGSATVAMITSVGILSGLVESGQLGCHPVFLALAIGCGSKPIAWMNDSDFWVICKMSDMTETEGLRYVTTMTASMGLAGLVATMVGAILVSS